jgi:hypothetical protein
MYIIEAFVKDMVHVLQCIKKKPMDWICIINHYFFSIYDICFIFIQYGSFIKLCVIAYVRFEVDIYFIPLDIISCNLLGFLISLKTYALNVSNIEFNFFMKVPFQYI